MKVLLDSDVLKEILGDSCPKTLGRGFLNQIGDAGNHSFWLSAFSVEKDIVEHLVNGDRENFTIVPLRQSTLMKAATLDGNDFEMRILVASAEEFHLDVILSRQPSRFRGCSMPVLTPEEFQRKIDSGELDRIDAVPFLDLKAQHCQVYNEIDNRLTDIIANTGFILGKHVEEFESAFAEIHGARFALGVSSGTDALHVALSALEIGPGDSVVIPVNTFIATAEAVSLTGATPLFVDCDRFYNMDVGQLEEVLRKRAKAERVKAVIPVHLYGQPANMDRIVALAHEYGCVVIEDACQAHLAEYRGRKVGNYGQFGAFSFYPGKNLGAYGEAGALITNDEALYGRARMIRQHGEVKRYHHTLIGHNYRMTAIQGAVLSAKLRHLNTWTEGRRRAAQLYNELLGEVDGIETPCEPNGVSCVYHLYVVQVEERDDLQNFLKDKGVATGLHYPVPLHLQAAYRSLGYGEGAFPAAERCAKKILSLPLFPEITDSQIRYVCNHVKTYYGRKGSV